MSTTVSELQHHSPEELVEIDQQISHQLETVEGRTEIPLLDENQKKAIIYELNRDIDNLKQGIEGSRRGQVRDAWDKLADISHNTSWDSRVFDAGHMAANKLYAAALFDTFESWENQGVVDDDLARRVYEAYFASSDLPTDFTGDYSSKLELFALSRRSRLGRRLAGSMVAGLVYDGTFGDVGNSIEKVWRSQHASEARLDTVATLDYLLRAAENEMYPTDSLQDSIHAQLEMMADDEDVSAFVAMVAGKALQEATKRAHEEWVFLEELPAEEQERLLARHEELQEQARIEQQMLHEAFPQFPHDSHLYRISLDACVQVDEGDFGILRTSRGDEADLHRIESKDTHGYSVDDLRLIKEAHTPSVLETIELESGIDMRQLPLETQMRFFRFMAESDKALYSRFTSVLRALDESDRNVLADAFLATEFGDDFGDSLLAIAEKVDAARLGRVLKVINGFRDKTEVFAHRFEQFDPDFAEDAKKAMDERLADAIAAIEYVAVHGEIDTDMGFAGELDVDNLEQAVGLLEKLGVCFDTISHVLEDTDVMVTDVVEENDNFRAFRLRSEIHGDVIVYIRPEGTRGYDAQYEYGKRGKDMPLHQQGAEASISFLVNPDDPHKLLFDKKSPLRGLSLRFDREGRRVDEAPDSELRDPTRQDGSISVDISSLFGDENSSQVKIGRLIAFGNKLRADKGYDEESLHHNNAYFDQEKYGSAQGFSQLANYVIRSLEQLAAAQSQKRQKRGLGRRSLQVASEQAA